VGDYGYVLDGDYSFLPRDFENDEYIPLDNSKEMCYTCTKKAVVYNVTVGRVECEDHTDMESD
jgi:hypothetical protein